MKILQGWWVKMLDCKVLWEKSANFLFRRKPLSWAIRRRASPKIKWRRSCINLCCLWWNLIRLIHGPTMFHNQLNSKQIYDRISGMWNMSSLVRVCTSKNTKCPSKALVAVSFSPAQKRWKFLQLVSTHNVTHITFHSFQVWFLPD